MSVRLRLRRMGKKKQPFYRIVVIDSRKARDGRYIENVGTYNPMTNPAQVNVEEDRVLYWLGKGASPSDTVKSFFRKKGIMLKWHLMQSGMDEIAIQGEVKKWEDQQVESGKKKEALIEQEKREKKKTVEVEKPKEAAVEEAVETTGSTEVPPVAEAGDSKAEVSTETGDV